MSRLFTRKLSYQGGRPSPHADSLPRLPVSSTPQGKSSEAWPRFWAPCPASWELRLVEELPSGVCWPDSCDGRKNLGACSWTPNASKESGPQRSTAFHRPTGVTGCGESGKSGGQGWAHMPGPGGVCCQGEGHSGESGAEVGVCALSISANVESAPT